MLAEAENRLIAAAAKIAVPYTASKHCESGYVGAALLTKAGHVYTGVNVDAVCGIGFCAEHAAVAEMLKHRESEIVAMAAVNSDGIPTTPCGRCRELLYQVNPSNLNMKVLLGDGESCLLSELLPRRWQETPGWE